MAMMIKVSRVALLMFGIATEGRVARKIVEGLKGVWSKGSAITDQLQLTLVPQSDIHAIHCMDLLLILSHVS